MNILDQRSWYRYIDLSKSVKFRPEPHPMRFTFTTTDILGSRMMRFKTYSIPKEFRATYDRYYKSYKDRKCQAT